MVRSSARLASTSAAEAGCPVWATSVRAWVAYWSHGPGADVASQFRQAHSRHVGRQLADDVHRAALDDVAHQIVELLVFGGCGTRSIET